MSLDATVMMALERSLAPFAAEGDWHQLLPRYVACAVFCEGRRVLDLTCGRGVGCEALRRLGAVRVVGLDARAEAVAWADSNLAGDGVEFRPLPAGGRLPFGDGSFDVILALASGHGLTREHLREARRLRAAGGLLVIADDEHPDATPASLLPRAERAPVRAPRGAAFRDAARELFGPPAIVYERPVLAFQYSSSATGERPWPHSSTILLERAEGRERAEKLWVFGDPEARLAELIELPYHLVVGQLRRQLSDARRKLEVLELNQTVLEGQMADKEKLVNDLDLEAYSLRQSLSNVTQELEAWRGHGGYGGDGASRAWQEAERERERDRERQAYVDSLWQSAYAWQEYAEGLQTELEQVQSELAMLQSRLEQQVEAERAQRESAELLRQRQAEPSQREIELARELDAVVSQLHDLEERFGRSRTQFVTTRDALELARAEIAEREKLIGTLRAELADNRERLDAFVLEVQAVLEERDQLKRDLAAVAAEQQQFEERKSKVEANAISLEDDIKQKGARIQQLERELVGAKVEATAREKDNVRLMQGKAALDRRVQELEAELGRLQRELEESRRPPEPPPVAAVAEEIAAAVEEAAPAVEEAAPVAEEAAPPVEVEGQKVEEAPPTVAIEGSTVEEAAPTVEVEGSTVDEAAPTVEVEGLKVEEVAPTVEEAAPAVEAAASEPEEPAPQVEPASERRGRTRRGRRSTPEPAAEPQPEPTAAAPEAQPEQPVDQPEPAAAAEVAVEPPPVRSARRSRRPRAGELFDTPPAEPTPAAGPAEAAPEGEPAAKSRRRRTRASSDEADRS